MGKIIPNHPKSSQIIPNPNYYLYTLHHLVSMNMNAPKSSQIQVMDDHVTLA